jgi:RNA polymerase sigma-70 factor (ECF subfamily)
MLSTDTLELYRPKVGPRPVRCEARVTGLDPIVRRAQQGDEAAFSELFRNHRGDVTRLVFRVLGPSADVDDVVQDVFVHVFRSLVNFRGESKFSTWLYRLTINVARMHLRRGRSRPRFADVPVPELNGEDEELGPEGETDRARRIGALYHLLDALSEKKRTVLVLHDFEGMSPKEISELVDAPIMTVRTRLFYARKELYGAIAADPALRPAVEALLGQLPGRPEADATISHAGISHTGGAE